MSVKKNGIIKIAYYISDYGYGHATRSSAVIQGLLDTINRVEITLRHSFAMPFLRANFRDERVIFRHMETDLGYFLKKDSLEPDRDRLNREYDSFIKQWDEKVEDEVSFLQDQQIDLILSDIVPTAFPAAKKAGIPSIGISNFTWYTAYEGLISEEKLAPLKKAYGSMDAFFSLAGENEPPWTTEKRSFDFFSRRIDEQEVHRIRQMLNPDGDKVLVYAGLGMKITHDSLDGVGLWDQEDVIFIVSSNMNISKGNVFHIPQDYLDSQNFIAAADLAITKAGWGSISEAVIGETPLLIIDRQSMKEDQNTIFFLKDLDLCKTISWEELQSLKINKKVINEYKHHVQKNHLNEIVDRINDIIVHRINEI
ncbi:glycosyltransferase [Bacillus sp. KH172YL63]|uniref:glycosyltransferase n=1 Tax=Bacillus sp. KH172YL63 TaxID=2709784 RepID=UPI0013E4A821|nr:glycosyltransferase [Bacillus sp. KH172YL63]BCB05850.1 hypothetical protein KH172YL63_39830 [Bacillus sp. KH172YL63]